ncbi:MAG TPA: hypothetical protein VFK57_00325 [Vicinamibacterales bacterium]|nr:hypothetical protein [Vicinamibacterales bacterium]
MTKTISSLTALMLAALLAAPVTAAAQGRGRGQAKKPARVEAKQKNNARGRDVAVDRDGHARIIHDYVREGSLPPGLAKRESLPPGLAKQLRERGELPPGLQKRLVRVPDAWERRLPPVPPYYRRYFAGDDLVIVDSRTNRIAYLIRDVLR